MWSKFDISSPLKLKQAAQAVGIFEVKKIGVTTIILLIIIQEIIIILKLFKTIKDRVTKVLRELIFPNNVPEFQIQIKSKSEPMDTFENFQTTASDETPQPKN